MISRVPLRDEVYRQILDRVQRGDLPSGSRVRDTVVAAQLGVSRTPVREALLRLVRDGVLESTVGRGFRVRHWIRPSCGRSAPSWGRWSRWPYACPACRNPGSSIG